MSPRRQTFLESEDFEMVQGHVVDSLRGHVDNLSGERILPAWKCHRVLLHILSGIFKSLPQNANGHAQKEMLKSETRLE